jgi:hypothetical protein
VQKVVGMQGHSIFWLAMQLLEGFFSFYTYRIRASWHRKRLWPGSKPDPGPTQQGSSSLLLFSAASPPAASSFEASSCAAAAAARALGPSRLLPARTPGVSFASLCSFYTPPSTPCASQCVPVLPVLLPATGDLGIASAPCTRPGIPAPTLSPSPPPLHWLLLLH